MDYSTIENSWKEFLETLSKKTDDSILSQVKCPLIELLDKQAHVDQAKKALFKPEVGHLLKLYLRSVSLGELSAKLETHQKIFLRAFGQDKFNHLKLLVRLKMMLEEKKPKKGLLAG